MNSVHQSHSHPFQRGRDAAVPVVDFLVVLSFIFALQVFRSSAAILAAIEDEETIIGNCLLFRRNPPGLRKLGSRRSMVCQLPSSTTELAGLDRTLSYCSPQRPRHCTRFRTVSTVMPRSVGNQSYSSSGVWWLVCHILKVLFATQGYMFSVSLNWYCIQHLGARSVDEEACTGSTHRHNRNPILST